MGGSLLVSGCGESSSESNARRGGTSGVGGASGASGAGGSSGASGTSGEGGLSGEGGAGGSSGASGAGGEGGEAGSLVPYFQPGTRLKPVVVAAAGGVDIIEGSGDMGWFDTELEFDCLFRKDQNGVERCFPAALVTIGMYADPGCGRPVLRTQGLPPCGTPRYPYVVVNDFETDGCGHRGFRVGDELPTATAYVRMSDGTCQQLTGEMPDDLHYYELEAVPPETFVGTERVNRPRHPDLDSYVREGDDGSWQVIAFFDKVRQSWCTDLAPQVTPPHRCIPPWTTWGGYFGDAACQLRAAEVDERSLCEWTPTVIMESDFVADSCPLMRSYELYDIAEVREVQVHVDDSGTCTADGTMIRAHVQSTHVDPSTLPALEEIEVGEGTIQGRFIGFDGVPFLPVWRGSGPFIEAQTGEACRPSAFADGALRCVPGSFVRMRPTDIYYEGPACSGAPLVLWTPDEPCLPDPPAPRGAVFVGDTSECASSPDLISDTVAFSGTSTATLISRTHPTTGDCEITDVANISVTPYLLGDQLDPVEVFGELERTIRN
jgi:hypothetical protein